MTFTPEAVVAPSSTEAVGVAWNGSHVVFSRPAAGELWAYDPAGAETSIFRRFTGGVTSVAADASGRLYGCQTPSRRVVTYHADGSASVPQTKLDGRFHNFPRYAAADGHGRVWFADPKLDLRAPGPQVFPLLDHASVLQLDPSEYGSWTLRRMTFDTRHPTVVALSGDQSTLYVVDSVNGEQQELRAYPVTTDGLGDSSVLATFAPADGYPVSGMAAGVHGHLVVAGKAGVVVLTGDGDIVEVIDVPGEATDVVFGDAGGLYVTTGDGALLRVDGAGNL